LCLRTWKEIEEEEGKEEGGKEEGVVVVVAWEEMDLEKEGVIDYQILHMKSMNGVMASPHNE